MKIADLPMQTTSGGPWTVLNADPVFGSSHDQCAIPYTFILLYILVLINGVLFIDVSKDPNSHLY